MRGFEHPDRAAERHHELDDEDFSRERRADRLADHTPAITYGMGYGGEEQEGPRITSAMTTLAYTVLNGSWADAREASKVLAELVLEA